MKLEIKSLTSRERSASNRVVLSDIRTSQKSKDQGRQRGAMWLLSLGYTESDLLSQVFWKPNSSRRKMAVAAGETG